MRRAKGEELNAAQPRRGCANDNAAFVAVAFDALPEPPERSGENRQRKEVTDQQTGAGWKGHHFDTKLLYFVRSVRFKKEIFF